MNVHTKVPTHIPLEGACNARHLGGYSTPFGSTRSYSLIRCEAPSHLTDRDMAALLKLGVRTVIDLRNKSELQQMPNPFASIPTVVLQHCPIFSCDEDIERFDAMDREDSYCWMLDRFQYGFCQALRVVAQSTGGVLFHCAAGKDRTGLLAALLLLLAGVEEQAVCAEYSYTQTLLAPWSQPEDSRQTAQPREALQRMHGAFPEYMQGAIRHLRRLYGGVESYLRAIGLSEEELVLLKHRMVRPADRYRFLSA